MASDVARKALLASARDNSSDKGIIELWYIINPRTDKFRQDLLNIARTTLSSKIVYQDKDRFANLAVDAVIRLNVSAEFPW